MPRDLFQEFGVKPASAPPLAGQPPAGRDLYQEFNLDPHGEAVRSFTPPSEPRDLLVEFGAQDTRDRLNKSVMDFRETLDSAREFGAGAAKQTVKDVTNLFSPNESVMKDYGTGRDLFKETGIAPAPNPKDVEAVNRVLGVTDDPEEMLLRPLIAQGASRTTAQSVLAGIRAEAKRRIEAGETPDAVSRWATGAYSRPLGQIKASPFEGFDKTGIARYWADYASGVVGSTGAAMAHAGRKLSVGPAERLGTDMTTWAERKMPTRPEFADKLVNAVGSMASFYVPGLGVQKGAVALSHLSPALSKWLGAGAMAGLEAAAEADQTYKQSIEQGIGQEEAASRADKAFLLNLGLLGVTNRIGLFNDIKGLGRRVAVAAAVEGPGQEGPQQVIQNRFTGQPLMEGVGEASAIGSIVGGGARALSTLAERGVTIEGEARRVAPDADQLMAGVTPVTAERTGPTEPGRTVEKGPSTVGAEIPAATAPTEVDEAAQEAATSTANDLAQPSTEQLESGNYRKGHAEIAGLDISIEHPQGSTRSGKDGSWRRRTADHYGYVKDVPARGPDKEHIDVYVKPGTAPTFNGDVFVVDQVKQDGKFDEPKVMIGYASGKDARAAYLRNYPADWKGLGGMTRVPMREFKAMLQKPEAFKKPLAVRQVSERQAFTREELQDLLSGQSDTGLRARVVEGSLRVRVVEGNQAIQGKTGELRNGGMIVLNDGRTYAHGPAARFEVLPTTEQKTTGGRTIAELATKPDEEAGVEAAVAMMPGTNYAGFIDDIAQPASSATTSGDPIRREDVLAPFLKALGVPVYEGRVAGKRLGYYRPKQETVRIKRASDLETAAHELAHLIDDRVFNGFGSQQGVAKTRPWIVGPNARTFANELRSVSYDQKKVYEGWAEYVRLWMTQPERARAAAPEFTKWFGRFIEQHEYGPAIRKAQTDMLAWFHQDALSRARSKIGEKADINQHLNSFWDRFRQSTSDDLHGVYRMERELTGEITPRGAYETSRLTRAAHSIVDGTLRFGHIARNPDGSYAFRGKGLEQILKPVSAELDDFLMYSVGRSARELLAQGREHLFTAGEIKAMLALERPAFRQAFKEYQVWNTANLDFAEAHGVINAEARRHWRRAEYLPFHRVGTGESRPSVGGAQGNWQGIKKLTGGTDNIKEVLGNMVGNAAMLIDVALKNEARTKIVQLARTRTGGGRFLEKIPPDSRKVKIDRDQVRDKLIEAAGASGQLDVERTIDDVLAGAPFLMDFLVHNQTPTGGNIMAMLKDGKPLYYEVVDPILYRAVSSLNRPVQPQIVRWLAIPKRIGQASITLTPDFALANIARDTVMGAIMSRSGFLPAIDSIRGLTARLTSDPAYAEYIANGGGYASYFVDEGAFRQHLARFYSSKGINPKTVIDAPSKLLYFMETLFDSFELSTRLGEFKRARAKGEHPRHAAYLGREVSTDFAMRGDSRTLGFFYDTVMFLRPAVVSMDRLFRGVAHDPNRGAIAAKTATIALVSAMLFLLNRDKNEYKDLEDWDRDSYWHFFIPTPGGGDLHFRYPKIWEVGAIATLAERSVERILDGSPKEYAKDFGRVLRQAFNLSFMPQALAPLYEQAINRDTFTGRPIEPRGLEELQPFLRAKPGTSETLRQLGMATQDLPEALQINPVRTEALLTGYLNTWAMYGLMASDAALFSDKLPERRLDQYPVIRRFFRQDPPLHTKHEQTFYEMLDETRRLRATMRELDRYWEERELSEQDEAGLASVGQLDRVQRDIAKIRQQAEIVRRSDLPPAEKRKELDELTAERNAIYKEAVKELQP